MIEIKDSPCLFNCQVGTTVIQGDIFVVIHRFFFSVIRRTFNPFGIQFQITNRLDSQRLYNRLVPLVDLGPWTLG